MNIFVAAWYYPPVTSSEGIVTYKLLRKSINHYDVFSSLSNKWSYDAQFNSFEEPNITTYTINTDNIDEWCEACIRKFEELYPLKKYDCIMTRSTPPESIRIGQYIKEKYPEVKWIASLADPVANNPYDLKRRIDDYPLLRKHEKDSLKRSLKDSDLSKLKQWKKRRDNGIKVLCDLREKEASVVEKADLIICPSERQLCYLNGEGGWRNNYFALPHSYSRDFYVEEEATHDDRIVFTYTGYSDDIRSLRPFVDAVKLLKESGSSAYQKILFRFVGNIPRAIADLVLNFNLYDSIQVEPSVDYYESLKLMQQSNWLIHVDAYFPELEPGGSIFFAGKLADYIGAKRPIIALTGEGTPAHEIVTNAGGITIRQDDIEMIADTIEKICSGEINATINNEYCESFESATVARKLDNKLKEICDNNQTHLISNHSKQKQFEKVLTICVPSYNVEDCLDRCLFTLTSCKYISYLDIIVVDDGSTDNTIRVAQEYEKRFADSVRVIHKENGGHGSTINVAMEIAKGYYFRVVDADDWIDSNEQDKVLEKILNRQIDTDIISTNYHVIKLESGDSLPIKQDCYVDYDKPLKLSEIDTSKVYFTMAGSIIKTEILKKTGMRLQEKTYYVDVEFILFPIPFIQTVTFLESYIYKYSQGSTEQSVYIPNMVKRYDHHERVLKRVIDYRMHTEMTDDQANYYDSILKRLLYTHYGLCIVYDENRIEGYRRIADFDDYLLEVYPEMAKWICRKYSVIMRARRVGFDYRKVKHSPENAYQLAKGKAIRLATSGSNLAIARKLIMNKYTYSIANTDFFKKGKGVEFRNKLERKLMN